MTYNKEDMRDSYNVGYRQAKKELINEVLKFGALAIVFYIVCVLIF